MPFTGQNFVYRLAASLVGAATGTAPAVTRANPNNAQQVVAAGNAAFADKVTVDFSADANAKHGAASVVLTGTTAASVDLTDLTSATSSSDGDTSFASFKQLVVQNLGAGSVTIAPGASNPAGIGLGGTSPTLTIPPGATHTLNYPAGVAVDSTHKVITFTPAASTVATIAVSGN